MTKTKMGQAMSDPAVMEFDPATVFLSTAMKHLRSNFADELQAIVDCQYSCWLGSGLSLTRFPGLKKLLRTLLEKLISKIDFVNSNCPWRKCITEVLQLAETSKSIAELQTPLSEWIGLEELLSRLVNRYSDVLDNKVYLADRSLSLTRDVLELHKIYGDESIEPDAEHRFLALLIQEGVFKELVSANWDGLIEKALMGTGFNSTELAIVVNSQDIVNSSNTKARLTKLHGCAKRCNINPEAIVELVATRTEIQTWEHHDSNRPILELIRTIIRERSTLFVGLSVQDWNLQGQMLESLMNGSTSPFTRPSRALFCQPEINQPQRVVLKHIYNEEYDHNKTEIDNFSRLRLYAKPFLGALYVECLRLKAVAVINANSGELTVPLLNFVKESIESIESWICMHFDQFSSSDGNLLWREMVQTLPGIISRFVRLFKRYEFPNDANEYFPLKTGCLSAFGRSLEEEDHSSLMWLLLIISVLCKGQQEGYWKLKSQLGKKGHLGQFGIEVHDREISVFVVPDSGTGSAKLSAKGILNHSISNTVVFYTESKQHLEGRHSVQDDFPYQSEGADSIEVWIRDYAGCDGPTQLLERLRYELL